MEADPRFGLLLLQQAARLEKSLVLLKLVVPPAGRQQSSLQKLVEIPTVSLSRKEVAGVSSSLGSIIAPFLHDTVEKLNGLKWTSPAVNLEQVELLLKESLGLQEQVAAGDVKVHLWQGASAQPWLVHKSPPFGPGRPTATAVAVAEVEGAAAAEGEGADGAGGLWWWVSLERALEAHSETWLPELRVGPLALWAASQLLQSTDSSSRDALLPRLLGSSASTEAGLEYPRGILTLPLPSRTLAPFSRTNLIVVAAAEAGKRGQEGSSEGSKVHQSGGGDVKARGSCLLVDPGCNAGTGRAVLAKLAQSLQQQKVLVFLTHHHVDHVEGLPGLQGLRPPPIVLAHERVLELAEAHMRGFEKVAVAGDDVIRVGAREIHVIAAPGHTSSHLALWDPQSRTIVAGDHCVGQGSALLDDGSGGDVQDWLDTCKRMMGLGPHVLIPAHGQPNLFPDHMLKALVRHRLEREQAILKAIEEGARTSYQVVSRAYTDAPRAIWPIALRTASLHVKCLAQMGRLPSDFSVRAFAASSRLDFHLRCLPDAGPLLLSYAWRRASARAGLALPASIALLCLLLAWRHLSS